jgi:hypothetical protein
MILGFPSAERLGGVPWKRETLKGNTDATVTAHNSRDVVNKQLIFAGFF